MTHHVNEPRSVAHHVFSIRKAALTLERSSVEFLFHAALRSLSSVRAFDREQQCVRTVRAFVRENPDTKQTFKEFERWLDDQDLEAMGYAKASAVTLYVGWDNAKAKAQEEARIDGEVLRLFRRPPQVTSPDRAERGLVSWLSVPGDGRLSGQSYTRHANAINHERQETDEELYPTCLSTVLSAIEATSLAEVVEKLAPEHLGRLAHHKGTRPRKWLEEDLDRCYAHYKRPYSPTEYLRWAEDPEGAAEARPRVSYATMSRRYGSVVKTAAALDRGNVVQHARRAGPRRTTREIASVLARAVSARFACSGDTLATTRDWDTASGADGPKVTVFNRKSLGAEAEKRGLRMSVRNAPLVLFDMHPEALPVGVTYEMLLEDRRER